MQGLPNFQMNKSSVKQTWPTLEALSPCKHTTCKSVWCVSWTLKFLTCDLHVFCNICSMYFRFLPVNINKYLKWMFIWDTCFVCVISVQPLNSDSKQTALIIKSTETGPSALTRADLCGPCRFPKPLSVNYWFSEPAVCLCVSTFLPLE